MRSRCTDKMQGSEYIASSVTLDNAQDAVKKRIGVSVVRDGKTGDMIVKLVNLLPVAVNAQVELLSLEGMNTTAVKTVFGGKTDRPTGSSCIRYNGGKREIRV